MYWLGFEISQLLEHRYILSCGKRIKQPKWSKRRYSTLEKGGEGAADQGGGFFQKSFDQQVLCP